MTCPGEHLQCDPGVTVRLIFQISKSHEKIPRSGLDPRGSPASGGVARGRVSRAPFAHLPVLEFSISALKPDASLTRTLPSPHTEKSFSKRVHILFPEEVDQLFPHLLKILVFQTLSLSLPSWRPHPHPSRPPPQETVEQAVLTSFPGARDTPTSNTPPLTRTHASPHSRPTGPCLSLPRFLTSTPASPPLPPTGPSPSHPTSGPLPTQSL